MAVEKRFDGIHSAAQVADAYRAIGRFVTSVADLDTAVASLHAELTRAPDDHQDFKAVSLDVDRKQEIINSLASFGPAAPVLSDIENLVDRADKLMSARQIVANGMLHTQAGQLVMSRLNLPAISKYERRSAEMLQASTLDRLATEADALTVRMFEIAIILRQMA